MSQPRYMKQRDQYSCGPVAIMNTLKWSGFKFSYEDQIEHFQSLCGCTSSEGTFHAPFDKALRIASKELGGFNVKRIYYPKLWQIEKHLEAGGVIVLSYSWEVDEDYSRHFSLITGISSSRRSFLMVNDFRKGPALKRITRQKFKSRNLRFQRTDSAYKGWFVSFKG